MGQMGWTWHTAGQQQQARARCALEVVAVAGVVGVVGMRSVLAHMRTAIGSAGDRNQAQMWTEMVEGNCMSFAVVQVLGTGMTRGVSANVEVLVFELGKMAGRHRVLDPS